MRISDIKFRNFFEDGPLKAVVSVTFDHALCVHDIKIIESENGVFLAMPSKRYKDSSFHDIVHPIGAEARAELTEVVLKKYNEALEQEEAYAEE